MRLRPGAYNAFLMTGPLNRRGEWGYVENASLGRTYSRLNITPSPFQLVAQNAEKRNFWQESKLQGDLCPPNGNSPTLRHSHWFATINTQKRGILRAARGNFDDR